jgi:hypothetical protein
VSDIDGAGQATTRDLESEVYAARDLHGDDLLTLRAKLTHARLSMTETSYRRALELARDSILLTIEECLQGAQAMEWQPLRSEFTLAGIEAAVAEQERAEQERVEQVRAPDEGTERELAEQAPDEQASVELEPVEQQLAQEQLAEQRLAGLEPVEQERAGAVPTGGARA